MSKLLKLQSLGISVILVYAIVKEPFTSNPFGSFLLKQLQYKSPSTTKLSGR